MALKKLTFRPGINRDITNYSQEGGWYACDKIRFRKGYPEKIGGWTVVNFDAFKGTCRAILTYGTTDNAQLVNFGTNAKVYAMSGTTVHDITPLRATFTTTATDNMFETVDTSTTLTINLAGHGASTGDFVTFTGSTDVGGIPAAEINTEHEVTRVVSGNEFEVTVTTAATSTVAAGGGTSITAAFQISIGYGSSTYGYGWGAGTWGRGTWGSGASTPVSLPERLLFLEQFNNDMIFNIQDGEMYYWQYNAALTNRATALSLLTGARAVPQQVGKAMFTTSGHLLALACTEYARATTAGQTISSITNVTTTATVTTSAAHGLDVGDWVELSGQTPIAYRGEFQVTEVPSTTTFKVVLLSDPGGSATTVGTYVSIDYSGTYDPLLIRWADVNADTGPVPEEWKPTVTNSAGFLRVKGGSKIITGYNTRQETLIFTDTTLNSLQFLGTDEVFGLQSITSNINITGPNVITEANNIVMWMGHDQFFLYDGRVQTLPCTLKQYIFDDINLGQASLFFAGSNREFDEVIWFYCSDNAVNIDRYVIYNYQEQIWYYGTLNRTAWFDSQIINYPLAASNGYIYKHEDGIDDGQPLSAAAQPINAYIQSADLTIEDGERFVLTKRVIPDVNFTTSDATSTPEVEMTVGVRNFPGALVSTDDVAGNTLTRDVITTATIDQYTNQVFVRARGRQMNFKIESNKVGTQWGLGSVRIDFKPDGRRG